MIDGIGEGYVLGHASGRTDTYTLFKIPTQTLLSTIQAGRVPRDSQGQPEFSKTFGIYVDQINLWYKIHPQSTLRPNGLLGMCFADKSAFTMEICDKNRRRHKVVRFLLNGEIIGFFEMVEFASYGKSAPI